jgi:hypothetical protein
LIQPGQPGFTHDRQRQLFFKANVLAGLQPGFTQGFQLTEQVVVVLTVGHEEQLHDRLKARAPHRGRRRQ